MQIGARVRDFITRRWPRTYGHEVRTFHLATCGAFQYAQWLHPFETPKTFSEEAMRWLKRFVSPGQCVLDIGAHTGDTAVPLALAVGQEGLVIAFEPNPRVFRILEVNARLNADRGRIVPCNLALTEMDGEFEFRYSDASLCNGGDLDSVSPGEHGHHYRLTVRGVEPLGYLRQNYGPHLGRLGFVKIDTEGHDESILRRLDPIIRAARPVIMAEVFVHLSPEERRSFCGYFDDLGYAAYLMGENFVPTPERAGLSAFLSGEHFDVIAVPRERDVISPDPAQRGP